MKSSKWIFGLTAAVLMLALAPSSFAQVRIDLTTFPSPSELNTNHHALIVDPATTGTGLQVSGLFIATAKLTTTTLTLSFGAPITSTPVADAGTMNGPGPAVTFNLPNADPIRIEGQSGVFASITAVASVDFAGGRIFINLPCSQAVDAVNCFGVDNSQSGTFRILGVRLDVSGKSAPLSVTASLSSGANNYLPPAVPSAVVISALDDGLEAPVIGNSGSTGVGVDQGSFLLFSNQLNLAAADGLATVSIREAFAGAWRTAAQMTPSPVAPGQVVTNGTNIRLKVDGLPSGVTLNIVTSSGATSGAVRRPTVASATTLTLTRPATSTSTSNQTTLTFGTTDLAQIETLILNLTLTGVPTANLTAGTSIVLSATIVPLGDAFDATGVPTVVGGYPRFVEETETLTIGTVSAASTTLLIPYAARFSSLNFETGIALANTTADPFTTGGATAQAGTVTVDLFPSTATGAGTRSTYVSSTATRTGTGMATDGTIPAGGLWAVNLSDILSRATPAVTGDFSGYIFIQTNFLNAHGVAFIYDGRGFTSNSPALVMPNPQQAPRSVGLEALNN